MMVRSTEQKEPNMNVENGLDGLLCGVVVGST